jgi:acyl carrier protein
VPFDQLRNDSSADPWKMTRENQTRQRLRRVIGRILHEKQIETAFSDTETLAEIGISSIDIVTLLLAVETTSALEIPQEEITTDMVRSVAAIDAPIGRLQRPIPMAA